MINLKRPEQIQMEVNKFISGFKTDINEINIKINDEFQDENIIKAIVGATKDISPRMLKPISPEGVNLNDLAIQIANGGFIDDLKLWFLKSEISQDIFNEWHYKTCGRVLKVIRDNYTNNEKRNLSPVNFGKAQKIVNMTLKHLYCFKDASDFEKYFQYCHMPIDQFILAWVKDEEKKSNVEKISNKLPAWTYLSYDNDPDGNCTYPQLVQHIIELIDNSEYKDLTVLQAEFVIWPQYRK